MYAHMPQKGQVATSPLVIRERKENQETGPPRLR